MFAGASLHQAAGTSASATPGYEQLLLQHELSTLQASCGTATGESAQVKWYKADPTSLDLLGPDGLTEEPHDSNWTTHPSGKWIIGNHPEATPEQLQQLVSMLEQHKSAFSYSLQDLPGYQGPPVDFHLIDPEKRMWSPPRHYTEVELQFGDEKVQEMLSTGIIREIDTRNSCASGVVLPMKRAPDGSCCLIAGSV